LPVHLPRVPVRRLDPCLHAAQRFRSPASGEGCAMHRVVVAVGRALAWVGLVLPWERWTGLSGGGTTRGFDLPEANLYVYVLIATSALAVAYAVRESKPLAIALA